MRKAVRIAMLVLIICGLALAGWLTLRSHEPSYKGKSLSYWIDPSISGGHETETDRSTALAAMSERAVPYLAEKLHWHPSTIMQRLYQKFPNFPLFIRYMQGGSDPRGPAAHSLGELGPLATSAIPELTMAITNADLPSGWYDRMCAKAALIKIKRESLAPYIDKLKDTSVNGVSSIENWLENAMMVGEFGTNAGAAVPNLILALGPTNHPVIQAHALIALGEIHTHPEASIPAIVPFLASPDVALRQKAVFALDHFRDAAKPAWTNLAQCLDDPDPWTRISAAAALKKIDPEAAAKAGVK